MDVVMAEAMDDSLFLLEVDASVGGEDTLGIVLKGSPLGDAVLCTATKTFGVKKQEHSAALFLGEVSLDGKTLVIRSCPTYSFQAEQSSRPDFSLLRTMLSESDAYRLGDPPGKRRKGGLVRSELYHAIPCSNAELNAELSSLGACEYSSSSSSIQHLHIDTVTEVIDAITVQLAPLGEDALLTDVTETLSAVFPESVLRAVMQMFSSSEKKLCPRKLSRHRARLMFASSASWLERTFIASWIGSLDDLAGMAVRIDNTPGAEPMWKYIPQESLSLHPRTRLDELFAVQPKWRRDALVPYLEDVVPSGTTVLQYLGKTVKEFTMGGIPFCSAS